MNLKPERDTAAANYMPEVASDLPYGFKEVLYLLMSSQRGLSDCD
jgi:hypothetical protein